jgi:hypothetical protein
MTRPICKRASRLHRHRFAATAELLERDELYPKRLPSSSIRFDRKPSPKATQKPKPKTTKQLAPTKKLHPFHWSFFIGCGMLIILFCLFVSAAISYWWQGFSDDLRYGMPRTAHYDARVGHDDAATPSHFLVMNLQKQIVITEFAGGDISKMTTYKGPMLLGEGQERTIATLAFVDTHHNGNLDMVLCVQQVRYVFLNDGKTFHSAQAVGKPTSEPRPTLAQPLEPEECPL